MTEQGSTPLALLAWLSPAFPVGSFAFSHGLEWAVEAGDIANASDLEAWLNSLLCYGSIRADAVILSLVLREPSRATEINELALALTSSAERHLETSAQGAAFLTAISSAWPKPAITDFIKSLGDADIAYPVALGVAAAAHSLPSRTTIASFVLATVSNLVSAVLRLGPIGQSEAQILIAKLTPNIVELGEWADSAALSDLGTCAWRSDIAAMRHETQYSRLFRS